MTAFDHTVLHLRNISQHLYGKLLFQKLLHPGIQHGRHLVKDHAADMTVLFVFQKALYIGSQGNTHATAVYDQDRRCICGGGQIIGAGSGGDSSYTIIIPHDSLHHCDLTVRCVLCQKIPGSVSICKKRIQVSGSCTDHTAVEHRIYVIRAAFKRSHLKATVHQRLKQPAGDQGFSASAGTCRKKYSRDLHLNLLPSSAAGNDIDRILTHHHMIPSDRF